MHWFKWTYFYGRALLYPERCFQGDGAASRATAVAGGWQRLFYAAQLGESTDRLVRGVVYSRAVSTSGSITRCSEREVAVLLSSSDFSKNVEATNSWFIPNRIIYYWSRAAASHLGLQIVFLEQQPRKNLCMGDIVQEIYWKRFSFYKFSCATMQA